MKVGKKIPFFAAIPTTAGTGSEVSVAAVITDENNHRKFAINDTKLIPSVAVLDPIFLKGMPAKIIAETGMDALTHAVEAFIGKSNTKKTEENAVSAVKLIDKYLITAYNDNNNTEALYNMQIASYKAGLAFTRAYVGYVHAIAHSLGGKYNIGHGYANAVILPYVLEVYGKKAYNKLALLAEDVGSDEDRMNVKQKAESFISYIRNLNKKLGISENFGGLIKNEDIEGLVSAAMKEAVPLYPVPKIFKKEEFIQIYNNIN